jgi:flagellar motor protein MotB
MLNKKFISLTLALTVAQAALAINNVAVLELLPNESVEKAIRIEESRHLTDELRRQAVMTLPKKDYSVLTRDNIIALSPPDEKEAECLAESCAIEIGRAIGAEYISQGTIGKFGNRLTISVELYETMGGKLISSIVFESKDIDGLLNGIRNEAKPLFQSILEDKTGIPPSDKPVYAKKLETLNSKTISVYKDARGTIINMSDILLETGKPEFQNKLAEIAEILKNQFPKSAITVEGHTDNAGDAASSKKLSEQIASAISNYLIARGIEKNRIKSVGYGSTKPIADNNTEQGRTKNRRVEIVMEGL